MDKIDLLGVKINDVNLSQATNIVLEWLSEPGKHYIVTPNPEFLVIAQTDTEFKNILNNADLAIPDGTGLKLSGKIQNTVTGTDFMEALISLANEKGFTIGLIGGSKNLADNLSKRLTDKYKNLKIGISDSNFNIKSDGSEVIDSKKNSATAKKDNGIYHPNLYNKIDILFVAFGHIKQEKWINKNIDKLNASVIMGVGGAFEYLSGNTPRAPRWLRVLGMEWFFRLITQPWRIKRQLSLLKYLWLLATT